MIEIYQAYADYEDMMDLIETLILRCALELNLEENISFQGKK